MQKLENKKNFSRVNNKLKKKFKKINIKRMISEIPTSLLIISNFHLINLDIMYRYNLMADESKNLKLK